MITGPGSRRAIVVEVLGLPATGKTTVVDGIASADGAVAVRRRSPADVAAHALSAIRLTSPLVTMVTKGCTPKDRNRLIRLGACSAIARRHVRRGAEAFVFDQGPVFLLRQLAGSGGACGAAIEPSWSGYLERWARALDLVVVLDAPDEVVLERVRARTKAHPLQRLSDAEACRHLAEDRQAFDLVLELLASHGTVRERRIDTSMMSPDETRASVGDAIAELVPA